MYWIDLAQDRNRWRALVIAVMNLQVSQIAENFLTSKGPVSFSGKTLFHGILCTFCVSQIFRKGARRPVLLGLKGSQGDNLLSPRMAADDKNARSSSPLFLYSSVSVSWCYRVRIITLLKIYKEK